MTLWPPDRTMLPLDDIDATLTTIEAMPRAELITVLRDLPCPFPIDFTDTYLEHLPIDRLKHLVAAVALHCRKSGSAA